MEMLSLKNTWEFLLKIQDGAEVVPKVLSSFLHFHKNLLKLFLQVLSVLLL